MATSEPSITPSKAPKVRENPEDEEIAQSMRKAGFPESIIDSLFATADDYAARYESEMLEAFGKQP